MRVDSSTMASALSASSSSSSSSSTIAGSEELGRDEFLTLLVTQLKYQDPLNPTDNSEFISQLAQFSSLQEIRNLSEATRQASELSVASSAAGLIGRPVAGEVVNTETGKTETVSGTVAGVAMKNGVPTLVLTDGSTLTLDQLTEIA